MSSAHTALFGRLAGIDIRHYHPSAFVRKQSSGLCSNALRRARDNCCLAEEHAPRVVQMRADLLGTFVCHVGGLLDDLLSCKIVEEDDQCSLPCPKLYVRAPQAAYTSDRHQNRAEAVGKGSANPK